MLRHYGYILASIFILIGCSPPTPSPEKPKQQTTVESEFKPPMGPWGLPYRVGNLGGKPVNLDGQLARYINYEVCPVWVWDKAEPECKKKQKRTYDSVIESFSFEMRYTDGLLMVRYYKAPQYSEEQYNAERNLIDSPWVTVGVNAGKMYVKDGDMDALLQRTLDEKPSQGVSSGLNYIYVYVSADESYYGLKKYVPHPEWISKYGYEKTTNLYVYQDDNPHHTTMIRCSNHPQPKRSCKMHFVVGSEMKVLVDALFRRKHLKDWQLIQEQARKVVLGFVVQPQDKSN